MSRNASGTYTLPIGAFSPGGVIKSGDHNSNYTDIATALTQSLATTGVSAMTGPILAANGTVGAPSISFNSSQKSGFYRVAADQIGWASNGVQGATFNSDTSVTWAGNQSFGGTTTTTGAATFNGTATLNAAVAVNANLTVASGAIKLGGSGTFDSTTVFVASGASHAIGTVPDPGASAGTTKYLREDATWHLPGGQTATTRQYLTSGAAATYTSPANVKTLVIKMVGGGGGGAGSTGSGGTGGDTIFNSIHAAGAGGGTLNGNAGTGGTGGTGSANLRLQGSNGGDAGVSSRGGIGAPGLYGLGAGLQNDSTGAGGAGAANTGAGGAGETASSHSPGGGGGEYAELIITSPSATYTYTIGAAGAAGTGTNGGGAGGTGLIIVEEYY